MKYKFVKHLQGMVLYINKVEYIHDSRGILAPKPYNVWRKATDEEAFEVMFLINKIHDLKE